MTRVRLGLIIHITGVLIALPHATFAAERTVAFAADGAGGIQAAIDASSNGDTILVGPGTYSPINTVGKKLTIKSAGGAEVTIIDGGNTQRCATLADDTFSFDLWNEEEVGDIPTGMCDTTLIGFTLRNGRVYWEGQIGYYEDNSGENNLPAKMPYGAGAFGGVLVNCIVMDNFADMVMMKGGVFKDSEETYVWDEDEHEIHAASVNFAKLYNCVVTQSNSTEMNLTGIAGCIAYNCTIVGNSAKVVHSGDDTKCDVIQAKLYNSIIGTTPIDDGGWFLRASRIEADNCALVSSDGSTFVGSQEWTEFGRSYKFDFITGDMKFVDAANGDYRLQEGSAAIDAGNDSHVQELNVQYGDLAGKTRKNGAVDIGAYEYRVFLPDGGPYTEIVDGIEWTFVVVEGEATVGSLEYPFSTAVPISTTGAIDIPTTLGGHPVTSIGHAAFEGCCDMTSIMIPKGVTSIGQFAITGCSSLRSITIPESVVSIWEPNFGGCCNLDLITVSPDNPTYSAVSGLLLTKDRQTLLSGSDLAQIKIPDDVTLIANYAFYGSTNLTSVIMPSSITNIQYFSFCGCTNLRNIIFAGDAPTIESGAFAPSLYEQSSTIEQCIASIPLGNDTYEVTDGKWQGFAVEYYKKLSEPIFTIEDGTLTAVELNGATEVVIPNGVTSIGEGVFVGRSELVRVTIPSCVTSIGDRAFYHCSGLTNVTLLGNVAHFGSDCFSGTPFYEDALCRMVVYGGCNSASSCEVSVIVTNVVVHYVTQSVSGAAVTPDTTSTGIVNIISEVNAGSAVAVTSEWATQYPSFTTKFGSDFTKAVTKPTGKRDGAGNAMYVWQDFVAGTDPTDEDDVFTASITFDKVTGDPVISWTPELTETEAAKRVYRKFGKVRLNDAEWSPIDGDEASYNFFKVSVEMK